MQVRPLLAASLLCCTLWTTTMAQDATRRRRTASTGNVSRPMAVVSVAGFDVLRRKIDYLAGLSESPRAKLSIDDMLAALTGGQRSLPGLDGGRRIGVIFPDVNATPPRVLAFVPVTDGQLFLRFIGSIAPMRPGPTPDIFQLATPMPLFVRVSGGWCWVATSFADIQGSLPAPRGLLRGAAGRNDIGVSFDIEALPRELREQFVQSQIQTTRRSLRGALGRNPLTSAFEKTWLQFVEQMWRVYLDGCSSVAFGVEISDSRRRAAFECEVEARPGSQLAELFRNYGSRPGRFASLGRLGQALAASSSFPLPPEQRQAFAAAVCDRSVVRVMPSRRRRTRCLASSATSSTRTSESGTSTSAASATSIAAVDCRSPAA